MSDVSLPCPYVLSWLLFVSLCLLYFFSFPLLPHPSLTSHAGQGWRSEWWSNPVRQGILRKQGHVVKNWKERWFVLQGDKLFYFKNRAEQKPQGCIVCKGTYVTPTKKVNKPFAFELADTRNNKVFFIHASSKSEMDSWIQALEKASQYQPVGEGAWNHKIHVDFQTTTGFVGLPTEWAALLQDAQITAQDFGDDAVAEMTGLMNFFTEEVAGGGAKKEEMPIPECDEDLRLEDLVNPADPTALYDDMKVLELVMSL